MFTGIIQELGKITQVKRQSNGKIIQIECKTILINLNTGDSVAINGACQTVIEKTNNSFFVYSSENTLSITNLNLLQNNDFVNLERPLSLNKLLDGHLVQGHIDGTGIIKKINKVNNEMNIEMETNDEILAYLVDKASISIDGISLTINEVFHKSFTLNIIPLTIELTSLKYKNIGDLVNIEIDLIAKYTRQFMKEKPNNSISTDLLKETGFM